LAGADAVIALVDDGGVMDGRQLMVLFDRDSFPEVCFVISLQ
jgi:hypothetical protein